MQVKSPHMFKMSHPSLSAIASVRPHMTSALMAETGLDEAVLTAVVHRFYDRIRNDGALEPVFERWLALFRDTAEESCTPAGAAHLRERARRIARSLDMAIEDNRGMGLCSVAAKPEDGRHVR